jgi:hypothetical protein
LGYLNPVGPPAFVQACFSVFGVCYFVDFIFPNSFVLFVFGLGLLAPVCAALTDTLLLWE